MVVLDIGRNVVSAKEPNLDVFLGPLDCKNVSDIYRQPSRGRQPKLTGIDTTTGSVETFTKGALVAQVSDTTTFISSLVRSTVVRVEPSSGEFTSLDVVGVLVDSTSGASVDRNLVLAECVDTLHDVDFTSIWPVVTVHPPCGPGTTSGRCVDSVHDDHTTSVSRFGSARVKG